MSDMPKEVFLRESTDDVGVPRIVTCGIDNPEATKYTRLDPNEFVVSRKELEAMRFTLNPKEPLHIYYYDRGHNAAIDKILEMRNDR